MKIILFLLLILVTSNANTISLQNYKELNEMTLKELIVDVLTESNKSFVIDKELDIDLLVYYSPNDVKNINFLKKILQMNGFELIFINETYLIKKIEEKKEIIENSNLNFIDLKYLNFTDIENILKLKQIEYTYLKNSNKVFINSTNEVFKQIKNFIETIDVLPKNQKIKLSIIETNLGKLKNYESLINASLSGSQKFLLNAVIGNSLNIDTNAESDSLESVFKFLKTNNISKSIINTEINLENNEDFKLISSQNIPFLTTSNNITDLRTNEINSYDYKDVGLNVTIKPIITNDLLNLSLNFSYTQLLDSNSDKPVTTKKELNQKITLSKENKKFILSGINNYSKISKVETIPYLSDLPILGALFTNDYINESYTTTTIIIEFVDDFKLNKSNALIIKEFDGCKFLELCEDSQGGGSLSASH